MARLFDPQPVAPTSPFDWDEETQRRWHGLTTRATHAKLPEQPVKIHICPTCFTVPTAAGTCFC
jgi:hypothetical protein